MLFSLSLIRGLDALVSTEMPFQKKTISGVNNFKSPQPQNTMLIFLCCSFEDCLITLLTTLSQVVSQCCYCQFQSPPNTTYLPRSVDCPHSVLIKLVHLQYLLLNMSDRRGPVHEEDSVQYVQRPTQEDISQGQFVLLLMLSNITHNAGRFSVTYCSLS